jgi:FkbM family methyltransferase
MRVALIRFLDWFLALSRLQYWPVRVRRGIAAGARWTLYPWSAYWRGTQEPAMHEALLGLGDIRGWSCWDLGAHYGIYSIGLARRTGPSGAVAAFEPNPVSYARLERHRRMNGLAWMKTFEAAVSDAAGTAPLLTYGDLRSTTTHLAYENETGGAATQPIGVRTVVLDDLVASGELRPPDFIKVDVEGHAHKALAGARQTLAAKRPILIIAFHSEPEVEGVFQLLEPLGYEHTVIATDSGSAHAIVGHDLLFRPKL